jgi:hypothetical protein
MRVREDLRVAGSDHPRERMSEEWLDIDSKSRDQEETHLPRSCQGGIIQAQEAISIGFRGFQGGNCVAREIRGKI